jgi:hypothetical protein
VVLKSRPGINQIDADTQACWRSRGAATNRAVEGLDSCNASCAASVKSYAAIRISSFIYWEWCSAMNVQQYFNDPGGMAGVPLAQRGAMRC